MLVKILTHAWLLLQVQYTREPPPLVYSMRIVNKHFTPFIVFLPIIRFGSFDLC